MNNKIRDGYHYNTKYWKNYKESLREEKELREVYIGCMLGDATLSQRGEKASIKFEQGLRNKEYLFHLFEISKRYVFKKEPGVRMEGNKVKSYYFRTFNLEIFKEIGDLFKVKGKKRIKEGLILEELSERGLAYWIMDDGSLNGKVTIIHTSGYEEKEVKILSAELNEKFGFRSEVIKHKEKYRVIRIKEGERLSELVRLSVC